MKLEIHKTPIQVNGQNFVQNGKIMEVGKKRIKLLKKIKKLHQVDGWNKENKRLKLKDSFADSLFSVETKL